jgi:hypothetical protein
VTTTSELPRFAADVGITLSGTTVAPVLRMPK